MSTKTKADAQLLEQVIAAFYQQTGVRLKGELNPLAANSGLPDGTIAIPATGVVLSIELKRWLPQAHLGALVEQVKRLPGEGVLVADYVNPKMAEKLKALQVQYLDAVGNAYLNQPPVFVYINTAKPVNKSISNPIRTRNRAFDAMGLKVVFGMLCDPKLVNATYRVIAQRTGVSLGTVGWVLNGLKESGFVVDRGRKGGRYLKQQRKLLSRWVEAYPERLRPKLAVGQYVADDSLWWQQLHAGSFNGVWSGEVAAARYTSYLKPQVATLYLPDIANSQLFDQVRLRKAAAWDPPGSGQVNLYRPFWPAEVQKNDRFPSELAHPILVYADLIATGDARNIEAAEVLYEQYIAEHIGED